MRGANRGNTITDDLFELLLDILANNKDHMVEACLNRIVNRVIHDDIVHVINWFQLLDSYSEAAADSSSHDK